MNIYRDNAAVLQILFSSKANSFRDYIINLYCEDCTYLGRQNQKAGNFSTVLC